MGGEGRGGGRGLRGSDEKALSAAHGRLLLLRRRLRRRRLCLLLILLRLHVDEGCVVVCLSQLRRLPMRRGEASLHAGVGQVVGLPPRISTSSGDWRP